MIYDSVNGICRSMSHETARAFCWDVLTFVKSRSMKHVECEIEGVQFSCFETDSVEDLLTRYTDRHREYVDFLECQKKLCVSRKQICVRTYTSGTNSQLDYGNVNGLNDYLEDGWCVVLATPMFGSVDDTKKYIEYILEKVE